MTFRARPDSDASTGSQISYLIGYSISSYLWIYCGLWVPTNSGTAKFSLELESQHPPQLVAGLSCTLASGNNDTTGGLDLHPRHLPIQDEPAEPNSTLAACLSLPPPPNDGTTWNGKTSVRTTTLTAWMSAVHTPAVVLLPCSSLPARMGDTVGAEESSSTNK